MLRCAVLCPGPQAALQSKRQELRASVAEGLRAVWQQQQDKQRRRQEGKAGGAEGGGKGDAGEEEGEVWCHHGFLEAYSSVRSEVLRLLETALAGGLLSAGVLQPGGGGVGVALRSGGWQAGSAGWRVGVQCALVQCAVAQAA